MLTFKQIEALYWAVKLGTFSAAADKLHTTQSAITKRIQELESKFDIVLFDRSGHKAALVGKGHEIFAIAEKMLADRDQLVARLEGHNVLTGTLRFGITEIMAMTWLPSLIRILRSRYPNIDLEPRIDMAGELQKQLLSGEIDLAFLNHKFLDGQLVSQPLRELEFAWMGCPDQLDADKVYTPAQLARMPLLRQSQESALNTVYDEWLSPHIAKKNLFTINSLIAMAGLAAAGFGICCLPREYFSDMVRQKQLVLLKTTVPAPSTLYCAAYRREAGSIFYESVAQLAKDCCDFSKARGQTPYGA
ncbi:LysR family transcriptional regulator [Parapusillimonas sp. JC17]|uniref:LysR family transcriptional regulator n=1 Tax=Parapusillimonas sp. JC17 TaxID=3445768 RepID=UPI003FA07B8B